jgi:hypothetical protein
MYTNDRPTLEADEIEITPEMIKAGARACILMGCYDETESVAITIYEAMERAGSTTRELHTPGTEPDPASHPE